MATPRLSRFLGGIFALCYLSSTTVIIWFCAFSASNTAMAGAFLSVTPTPCSKPAPNSAPSLIQSASGTIKSTSGQTLQIIPETPGKPIIATYSSTTRITEQTLITTPSASVLKKGIYVFIQAIPNPNGTFTATLIALIPGNQPDNPGCLAEPALFNASGSGQKPVIFSTPSFTASSNPTTSKKSLVRLGDQLGGGGCPTQKTAPVAPTPTPSVSKQSTCWIISGTVELLNGNTSQS